MPKGSSQFLRVWHKTVASCGCPISAYTVVTQRRGGATKHAAASLRVPVVCPVCKQEAYVEKRHIRSK